MLSDAAPLIGFIVPSFDCTRNRVCETLLQTEEDDDRRQRADRDRRHDHAVVDDVAAHRVGDQHRHGNRLVGLHDDLRPEICVPRAHERDGRGGGVGRLHHRNEHPNENLEFIQAVDARRLERIPREAARAVSEIHNQKRRRDARQDEARPRVDELRLGEHLEQRNENRHKRHHHRQHQNRHHGVLRLVVIDFKAVARDGADRKRGKGLQEGRRERVFQRAHDVVLLEQVRAREQPAAQNLLGVVKRGDKAPIQREYGNQRHGDQKDVHDRARSVFAKGAFSHRLSPTFIWIAASTATMTKMTKDIAAA